MRANRTCFTLANGFPAPATSRQLRPQSSLRPSLRDGVEPRSAEDAAVQMVLNLGYNGARSNHLDVKLAPRALPNSTGTDPSDLLFNYEEAEAYYKTTRLRCA